MSCSLVDLPASALWDSKQSPFMLQPPSLARGSAQVSEPQTVVRKSLVLQEAPSPTRRRLHPAAQHLFWLQHLHHLHLGLRALVHEAFQLTLIRGIRHLAPTLSRRFDFRWAKAVSCNTGSTTLCRRYGIGAEWTLEPTHLWCLSLKLNPDVTRELGPGLGGGKVDRKGMGPGRLHGLQTLLDPNVSPRPWLVLIQHLFNPIPYPPYFLLVSHFSQLSPFLAFHSFPSLNLLSSTENSPKVNFSLMGV